MKALIVVLVASFSGYAQADMFKCLVSGNTVYQDKPCAGETKWIMRDAAGDRARAESERKVKDAEKEQERKNRMAACKFVQAKIGGDVYAWYLAESCGLKERGQRIERSENTDMSGTYVHYRVYNQFDHMHLMVSAKDGVIFHISQ